MKIIDSTLSLPEYITNFTNFVISSDMKGTSIGHYASFAKVIPQKYKTLFTRKEKERNNYKNLFEMVHGEIRILSECWNEVLPLIKEAIEKYEKDSGKNVTVVKIDSLVRWAD